MTSDLLRRRRVRVAGACAAAALLLFTFHPLPMLAQTLGHDTIGVLSEPALHSDRATGSVLLAISKAGRRLIAAGERGLIIASDDDGRTWQQSDVPVSVTLTGVMFVNSSDGWAIGHSGVILVSHDGGRSWRKQLDGREGAALALYEVQTRTTADPVRDRARIKQNADLLAHDGPDKPLLDLWAPDPSHALSVGAYGLAFATADGGAHWDSIIARVDDPQGLHLYAIASLDDALLLVGEGGMIYRSDDAGRSFHASRTPFNGTLFGITRSGDGSVYAYGLRGACLRSDDLGRSWKAIECGTNDNIARMIRLHDGSLAWVSHGGALFLGKPGVGNWRRVPLPKSFPFSDVVESERGILVLVGMEGILRVDYPPSL
jgi:photosystem II stability/assembly factor-like uncharacterized protein